MSTTRIKKNACQDVGMASRLRKSPICSTGPALVHQTAQVWISPSLQSPSCVSPPSFAAPA